MEYSVCVAYDGGQCTMQSNYIIYNSERTKNESSAQQLIVFMQH